MLNRRFKLLILWHSINLLFAAICLAEGFDHVRFQRTPQNPLVIRTATTTTLQILVFHRAPFLVRRATTILRTYLVSVQIVQLSKFCCESFTFSRQECLSNSSESRNKDCLVP